jgi:bifunctional DNase/RNase
MIEVRIESVRVSLMSPNQIVILRELDGDRRLPIFIGKAEGDAISFRLNEISVPRPLSHDLAASIVSALDARVSQVVISDVHNQHFFATIHIETDGEGAGVVMDARPSDALAIASRAECPIFVEEHVMEEVGVLPPGERAASGTDAGENVGAFDDFISSLDFSDLDDDKKQ